MAQDGGNRAVVMAHDGKSLFERGSVMARCFAFVEVVDKCEVRIEQLIGLLHAAYAPIHIGRIAVLQIVHGGYIATGYKSLMTHQHTIRKATPSELLRGMQTAHHQEVTVGIDNGCLAIHYSGAIVTDGLSHSLQGIGGMKRIAGIEKYQILAGSHLQTLIHSIIQPLIRLTHHAYRQLRSLYKCHSIVAGSTIYHNILVVGKGLLLDTAQGGWQRRSGVERNGDDRE